MYAFTTIWKLSCHRNNLIDKFKIKSPRLDFLSDLLKNLSGSRLQCICPNYGAWGVCGQIRPFSFYFPIFLLFFYHCFECKISHLGGLAHMQ